MAKALFQRTIPQSKKLNSDNADELRVIGAGLPRTGTSSLQAALEILGFGPCHHMTELFDKPERSSHFIRAFDGYKVDFYSLMKGYGSTVDSPAGNFYKEIHQVYPKAKIILTVRDSGETWFKSFDNTLTSVYTANSYYFTVYPIRFLRLQCFVARKVAQQWKAKFCSISPQLHDLYMKRVIDENNASDILVFNVKDGWAPLCKFLGVDVPQDVPFPHINDTESLQRAVATARKIGYCAWSVLSIVIVVAAYFLFRLTV